MSNTDHELFITYYFSYVDEKNPNIPKYYDEFSVDQWNYFHGDKNRNERSIAYRYIQQMDIKIFGGGKRATPVTTKCVQNSLILKIFNSYKAERPSH